jgi:hypothetical protein
MKRTRFACVPAGAGVLLAVIVAGCLPFPLGDPSQSKADPKLTGHWFFDDAERPMVVSLYPFDEHAYVVESRDCKRDAGKLELQGHTLWKGWLTNIKGKTFLTLDPLAQHLESNQNEKKSYPVFRIEWVGEQISTRRVNEDFEPMKQVKSAQEEEALIVKEIDNDALYAGPSTLFRRLDPQRDKEIFDTVLKDEH